MHLHFIAFRFLGLFFIQRFRINSFVASVIVKTTYNANLTSFFFFLTLWESQIYFPDYRTYCQAYANCSNTKHMALRIKDRNSRKLHKKFDNLKRKF